MVSASYVIGKRPNLSSSVDSAVTVTQRVGCVDVQASTLFHLNLLCPTPPTTQLLLLGLQDAVHRMNERVKTCIIILYCPTPSIPSFSRILIRDNYGFSFFILLLF